MAATLESFYNQSPNEQYVWLKGNLHTHTTLSDGSRDPQVVVDLYAALGHDFLAITDHDVWSNYSKLDPKGLIFLTGVEVTAHGPHVLQVGGNERVLPHEDRQEVIAKINATGGFAVLNHPNWESNWNHYPYDLMLKLNGYAGVEIFNGVCLDLEGSHLGLDKWERLLSAGRIVWGFAHDDSHHAGHEGRAWNVVQVNRGEATPAAILAAFRAGRFYGSTGVTIDTIEVNRTELHIKAANAQAIELYGDKGRRLAHVEGSEIRFDAATANSFYIRAELYGKGTSMAWTQPFLIKGGEADQRRILEEKFAGLDAVRPTAQALRVEKIGTLGSDQTEQLWKRAPQAAGFYDRRTGAPAAHETVIRALVSKTELALRIDCEEPAMEKIRAVITEEGSGSIWTDDSLEIFLDVEGARKRTYQMMINPLGTFSAHHHAAWEKALKYKTRAVKGPTGWSAEILLDLATLAPTMDVQPGTRMGLHVCRNRKLAKEIYMWSWVGSSNHTPSRYGWLLL